MAVGRRIALFVAVFGAAAAYAADAPAARHVQLCVDAGDDVVVDVVERTMLLCVDGAVDATFPVNLGAGGVGKTKQGDRKTPLGRYPLAAPRASHSGFTWFVPVGYPTATQRAQGYTGGAIGIHGPPDYIPQALVDIAFGTPWTDGCIMVRTKEEIEAVRAFLLRHKPRFVRIVDASRS